MFPTKAAAVSLIFRHVVDYNLIQLNKSASKINAI